MGDHSLFSDFSDEELEAELKSRKEKRPLSKALGNINWSPVLNYVVEGIESVDKGHGVPKDFEHYIMEAVLEAVYGKSIWKWWNSKQ